MAAAGSWGATQVGHMNKELEARCMRQIKKLLQPEVIHDILVVAVSETSWMAQAVMKDGNDRRFRFQGKQLYDEATIGDVRVA